MNANISDRAMLINLSISVWTARKHDKSATAHVEAHFNATDAGRFNKALIAQEAIKAVQKTANTARTFHYTNTLPWSDEGYRVLPAANFQAYSAGMRQLHAAYDSAVTEFLAHYDDLVIDAKRRLNGLFNPDDYPRDISARFGFGTDITPIPSRSDFRVDLGVAEVEQIQADIENRTNQAIHAGHADLYRRLAEAIGHMADRLGDTDAIFRDSLIENLQELCGLLPKLDIIGDADLQRLRRDAESKLCRYAPQVLREDPAVRQEVAKDATAILAAMEGFYNASA